MNEESESSQRDMQTCLIDEEVKNIVESSSEESSRPVLLPKEMLNSDTTLTKTKRYKKRAVTKNGYTNLYKDHVPLSGMSSAFQDLFTYLVDCRWRVLFFVLIASFVISWFIFGILYWIVAFGHGDLKGHELHDPNNDKAVICMRDRTLCLMFRVGDVRKSRLLGATLNARLLQHRISPEGERLPHYQHTLNLAVDSTGSEVFLLWPLTVVHRIDSNSPLYDLSAADLSTARFEIIIILSGTVETMGQDTEARTSYLACEILWGQRYRSLVKNTKHGYILDYRRFNQTIPVETPRCSARQLHYWTHNYVLLNKEKTLLGTDFHEEKETNHQNKDNISKEKITTDRTSNKIDNNIKKEFHTSLISLIDKRSHTGLATFSGDDLTTVEGFL
ncbi:inward rectifier potassium channel 2-like isoform X3 [Lycorma delicatula]|uniref:inward rectifier potassium channel 2-like isoform X3 n=1 Tax=Lycorma delicatula TaxID=130591 RepID=UPI003F51355D